MAVNHPPGAPVLGRRRPWRPSPAAAPGSARGVRTSNPPACGSRRPGRIWPAATQVRRAAGGRGRGGAAGRGRGRGPLARAPEAPRAVAPAGRPCAASAADGGGGAGARGPARAPGAARSACEPPAGRDSGPEGEAGGQAGCRRGRGGERPPRSRAVAEAAGDPRPASVSPLGCSAARQPRLGGPRLPPGPSRLAPPRPRPPASPPLPIPGSEPPSSQAHARGPASSRPPPPPPPAGSSGTRGARRCLRGRAPHGGPGAPGPSARLQVRRAAPGHLKTSPQQEGGGGDWPGAAGCAGGGGGRGERAGAALGLFPPKLRPAPGSPLRRAAPARQLAPPRPGRESPEEPRVWESPGVLRAGGGGAGRPGAFLRAERAWRSGET